MNNNKSLILIILIIAIVAVIILLQNPFKTSETIIGELKNNENTGLDIGDLAPDFILTSVDGNEIQLSSFRNKKPVIINFWATWCPPCRTEMPIFEEIYSKNNNKFELLGINLQESERAIGNFVADIPLSFPLLLDPNKDVKELYNIFTQPVTYFVDKEGKIVDKKFGPLTESEIDEKFFSLFEP